MLQNTSSLKKVLAIHDIYHDLYSFLHQQEEKKGTKYWLLLRQVSKGLCSAVTPQLIFLPINWTLKPSSSREKSVEGEGKSVCRSTAERLLKRKRSSPLVNDQGHDMDRVTILMRLLSQLRNIQSVEIRVFWNREPALRLILKEFQVESLLAKGASTTNPIAVKLKGGKELPSSGDAFAMSQLLSGNAGQLLELYQQDENLIDINLQEIHGVHLRSLNLSGKALAIRNLIHLNALETFKSMEKLDLSTTSFDNVGVLAGHTLLRELNISFTKAIDLSALANCTSLHTLSVFWTQVSDVSALANCVKLESLCLTGTKVTDLSPLTNCSLLRDLDLTETAITGIGPLANCTSLHTLELSRTQVSDVSALGNCTSLETLSLSDTKVTDVSALGRCTLLQTLNLSNTKVTDVSALGGCTSLRTLDLSHTNVGDVRHLGYCTSLHTLDLRQASVYDLSGLAGCVSLHTLNLSEGENYSGESAIFRVPDVNYDEPLYMPRMWE